MTNSIRMPVEKTPKEEEDEDEDEEEEEGVTEKREDEEEEKEEEGKGINQEEVMKTRVLKKKLQVTEGEKRALLQDCEEAKEKNRDEMAKLREEIKCLRDCLKEAEAPQYDKFLTEAVYDAHRHLFSALRKMPLSEASAFLESKLADAKKLNNRLCHEIAVQEEKLALLSAEIEITQQDLDRINLELDGSPDAGIVRSLENQLYKTQAKLIEAEHVARKYESIQSLLIEARGSYPNELESLKKQVIKTKEKESCPSYNSIFFLSATLVSAQNEAAEVFLQVKEGEIDFIRMEASYENAIASRDSMRETLTAFEQKVAAAKEARDQHLVHIRQQVEEWQAQSSPGPDAYRHLTPLPSPNPFLSKESPDTDTFRFPGSGEDKDQEENLKRILLDLKDALGVSDIHGLRERCREQRSRELRLLECKDDTLKEVENLKEMKHSLSLERDRLWFRETELDKELAEHLLEGHQLISAERQKAEDHNQTIDHLMSTVAQVQHALVHLLESLQVVETPESAMIVTLETDPWKMPEVLDFTRLKVKVLKDSLRDVDFKDALQDLQDAEFASTGASSQSQWNSRLGSLREGGSGEGGGSSEDEGEETNAPSRTNLKKQAKKILDLNRTAAAQRPLGDKPSTAKSRR
ncbi:unnamed protein product [Darwinula stevensoni]|uniref:Uncharacterized protein n=1 Tax=Darwinula stevensoni TaxID=69355 RepID=A0A7R9A2Q0_9CRUS|nr:unnamed protein product [Darwinula stevensoni]CAG0886115.1 unnamed protein product [Darwinula stevensoni]